MTYEQKEKQRLDRLEKANALIKMNVDVKLLTVNLAKDIISELLPFISMSHDRFSKLMKNEISDIMDKYKDEVNDIINSKSL